MRQLAGLIGWVSTGLVLWPVAFCVFGYGTIAASLYWAASRLFGWPRVSATIFAASRRHSGVLARIPGWVLRWGLP
jgi:hypothetical protein